MSILSMPLEALISIRSARNDLLLCESYPGHYSALINHAEKEIRRAKKLIANQKPQRTNLSNKIVSSKPLENTCCITNKFI